jgi:hypothetical protein
VLRRAEAKQRKALIVVLPGRPSPGLGLTIALGPPVYPAALTIFRLAYGLFHQDVTGVTISSRQLFTEARTYSIGSKLATPH